MTQSHDIHSAGHAALVDETYAMIDTWPRFVGVPPRGRLPDNGIYVFFERGEVAARRGGIVDRVVRIGTHKRDGRLRERLSYHYRTKCLSVFRKHLGGALLRRGDASDPRLQPWLNGDGPPLPEVEAMVDRTLREEFSYACVRVDRQQDRLELEQGLIALFARHALTGPSPDWLGRHAVDERIRRSGLWNTQHVHGESLTRDQLCRLAQLAAAS